MLLRIARYCLLGLIGIVALAAALFGYFIYSPDPAPPRLSGELERGAIEVGTLNRKYMSYIPGALPEGSPLVIVMHGSGENGARIRLETGYGFDRLADEFGFAVLYPDSYSDDWNDCGKFGDYTENGREVDDVSFLVALVERFVTEHRLDRNRVFATGVSAGGFMSLRLALEAPASFRAVAAVAASMQTTDNFKCKPVGTVPPVLIMDGTKDPLVPFQGGEVNLLGLFYKGGNVISARQSAQYFADLDHIDGQPESEQSVSDGVAIERLRWRKDANVETAVELVAIRNGGHGLPQHYFRRPRLLGPSPMSPDGPRLIWDFFAKH